MTFFTRPTSSFLRQRYLIAVIAASLTVVTTLWILRDPLKIRILGLLDPFSFNGDALQHISPLWFVHRPVDTVQDYTLRYYLQAILPLLFKQIYALLTLVLTPASASKIITGVLSVIFIIISTATTKRLAGGAAAALTFFLACGGVVRNLYFMGGIQRGFGFCLAAVALYLLCHGSIISLACLAVISAMLYPAAAVLLFAVLGLVCMLPSRYRGSAQSWGLGKRALLLASCALSIGVAVLPQLLGGKLYGERLSIDAEGQYEEWSGNGRYTPGDRGVPISFWNKSLSSMVSALSAERQSKEKMSSLGEPESRKAQKHSILQDTLPIIVATGLVGLVALIKVRFRISPEAVRCGIFFLGTYVTFTAADLLFPLLYIPSRYIALGLIALIPVVFPSVWAATVRAFTPAVGIRLAGVTTILVGAGIFASLGWHHLSVKSLPTASGNRSLFAFIKRLPQESVVATWPRGVASMIPLFTARSVLVFEEGHQIFHREFLEEMRRRTRAIIAAYSATDPAPLAELRDRYHVSHILISKKHFTKTPTYFAPFGREIREAREALGTKPLFLSGLINTHTVYSDNDYVIIDISTIELAE